MLTDALAAEMQGEPGSGRREAAGRNRGADAGRQAAGNAKGARERAQPNGRTAVEDSRRPGGRGTSGIASCSTRQGALGGRCVETGTRIGWEKIV